MAEELDANQIMQRLADRYSRFATYQDSGYVTSIHGPGTAEESHSTILFSTLFRRPNFFRFEWLEPGTRRLPPRSYVIWCDGHRAYKKYAFSRTKSAPSLSQIISGATGFSRGVAGTIPSLLVSESKGRKITDEKSLILVGTETLAGEECFHLRHESAHDLDLWISSSRLVILKIFEQFIVGEGMDAGEWVSSQAFKSITGFVRWLKLRGHIKKGAPKEIFHVIEQTFYTKIIIDQALPDHAFTREGMG